MSDAQIEVDDDRKNGGRAVHPNWPSKEHQFKPGNLGRPKGSRNKLGEAFIEALYDDFREHGIEAVRACRATAPDVYLRVLASLMPKELAIEVTNRYVMRTPEIAERLDAWLEKTLELTAGVPVVKEGGDVATD